ncbi:MAG: glycosyltransferase family 39 protein [Planctomycetota bacterium]
MTSTRQPWTRWELVGLAAGLALFAYLQQPYLTGPIANLPITPQNPFGNLKGFLDAQFWVFTTSHAEKGLAVTHGLPVWSVATDGTLAVHNSHPPTVALLEWVCSWFCGPTLVAVRLPALLFSTAMLAVVYLLLRRLFPRLPACLGTLGLATQPLFFHFATCPEVFLLGHLPLLGFLLVALRAPPTPAAESAAAAAAERLAPGADPPDPPAPPAAPAPPARPGSPPSPPPAPGAVPAAGRRRLLALGLWAAASVAVSNPSAGVIFLWSAAWVALRRNRASWQDAAGALAGVVAALAVLLTWLHWGGGSVDHWAERGIFRTLGANHDQTGALGPGAIGWFALLARQATRVGDGQLWLLWFGLFGCGLAVAAQFRRAEAVAMGRRLPAEAALLIAFALLFLFEAVLLRQNAWTHLYTVSAGGFLTAFGLAAIGEECLIGFQRMAQVFAPPVAAADTTDAATDAAATDAPVSTASAAEIVRQKRVGPTHLMGIVLTLTALLAMYRVSGILDKQEALANRPEADIGPLAQAIAAAHATHPGPVLVYPDWLLPARIVTGTPLPLTRGYIFPYFYEGRAFLCDRCPDLTPAQFAAPTRPALVLWPDDPRFPFATDPARDQAIRAALQADGYARTTVQQVNIYALETRPSAPTTPPASASPALAPSVLNRSPAETAP